MSASDYRETQIEIASNGMVLRIVRMRWDAPIDRNWALPDLAMLDMCLSPRPAFARARFERHWPTHMFRPMGKLLLFPADEPVHTLADKGEQMALQCLFEDSRIKRRWGDRQLRASLNINSQSLMHSCGRLVTELNQPRLGGRHVVEALGQLIVADLTCYFAELEAREAQVRGGLSPWRLALIDERLAGGGPPPTLQELADLCAMSIRQLSRAYRQSRGESIGACAMRRRMSHARTLLRGPQTIALIAEQLGFATAAAFSNAFRSHFGLSPRDCRAMLRRVH